MSKDERKYEFKSKVKVPDVSEISKVAADFSDPVIPKTKSSVGESLSKKAKVAKLDSTITDMQRQMNKLAREVIKEETTKPAEATDNEAVAEQKNVSEDKPLNENVDKTAPEKKSDSKKDDQKSDNKRSEAKKDTSSKSASKSKKKTSENKNDNKS